MSKFPRRSYSILKDWFPRDVNKAHLSSNGERNFSCWSLDVNSNWKLRKFIKNVPVLHIPGNVPNAKETVPPFGQSIVIDANGI